MTAPESRAPADFDRTRVIRHVKDVRAFRRQVSYFAVLNFAFWLSWIIGGIRDEWVAPWPLVPTVVWGAFLLYWVHRLGGRTAVTRAALEREIESVRRHEVAEAAGGPGQRPVVFHNPASFTPTADFRLSKAIDARRQKPRKRVIDLRDPKVRDGPGPSRKRR